MKRTAVIIVGLVLVLGAGALAAQERAAFQERVEEGRRMFTTQGCYGCHMVGKFGTPIGPDLSRVGVKYSQDYLTRWLRDPSLQRPSAHMPKLELTEPQIAALAAFLSSLD